MRKFLAIFEVLIWLAASCFHTIAATNQIKVLNSNSNANFTGSSLTVKGGQVVLVPVTTTNWMIIQPAEVQTVSNRWAPVVSAIIPLLGMIITVAIVLRTSRVSILTINESMRTQREIADRNLNAQVRSKNRQEWINEVRSQVSDFISLLPVKYARLQDEASNAVDLRAAQANCKMRRDSSGDAELRLALEAHRNAKNLNDNCRLELARALAKAILLLNPTEKDNIELVDEMKEAFLDVSDSESLVENKVELHIKSITQKTQHILKAEWERVKRFE